MSKITIDIPDDRWFDTSWDVRPADKELCIVVGKYGDGTPNICQFRHFDKINKNKGGCFLCIENPEKQIT